MRGFLARLGLELEDTLRFDPRARRLVSAAWRLQAMARRCTSDTDRVRRVQKLSAAACLPSEARARQAIEASILETVAQVRGASIDWTRIYPDLGNPDVYPAVILKPPVSSREKGVLLVSFEKQWMKLLVHKRMREIAQDFTLIIAPSWTPPYSCAVTVFPKLFPDPVFATISHDDDLSTLARLSDRVIPVPLLASNWVNPDDFEPLPRDRRDVDVVVVATFGKYKRHHVLLKALAQVPRSLRVLLVGTDNPDLGASGVRALARAYGVEDRLVDVRAEDYRGVARAFCRAKISVITSRREGSCQAVVESMFADTPVGILAGSEIGSAKYVNSHTGRMLREEHLARDIMELLSSSATMAPRAWVMENELSCHHSTAVLDGILRQHAQRAGRPWTRAIAPHAWSPYPDLFRREDVDAMASTYRDFHERFGLVLGPDPGKWRAQPPAAAPR